jgi:hypothetical protein
MSRRPRRLRGHRRQSCAGSVPDGPPAALLRRAVQSFSIHYGQLKPFLPDPGAAYHVEPQEKIDGLRCTLEACAIFTDAPPRKYNFWAHMSVAEFTSVEKTEELMTDPVAIRLSGSFLCDCVWHMVPDTRFHFTERRQLWLR